VVQISLFGDLVSLYMSFFFQMKFLTWTNSNSKLWFLFMTISSF